MKRIISLLLALAMLFSLAACGKQEAAPAPAETQPVPATAEIAEVVETTEAVVPAYPVTVTDHAGRTVTFEKEPERIVSGYYIATSALMALGLKDRLVGIEAKAGSRAIYRLCAPELIDLPNVGTAKSFDLEGCIALNPDCEVLPMKLKSVAEDLEKLDIRVVFVNPESQELLLSMTDMAAAICNVPDAAEALHSFIAEQEAVLAGISGEEPSVYLAGNSALLTVAGGGMYQSNLITLAGGKNAAEEIADSNWAEVSYEQLLAWDPEYIVLAADADYSVEDVLNDPNLSDCRAVKNGNVLHIPNDIESWDSPVPGGILGALWLASRLHGDVVTESYAEQTANDFYGQFYGLQK